MGLTGIYTISLIHALERRLWKFVGFKGLFGVVGVFDGLHWFYY